MTEPEYAEGGAVPEASEAVVEAGEEVAAPEQPAAEEAAEEAAEPTSDEAAEEAAAE